MAADSQNCARETQTMSQIEAKEAVDGDETAQTKGKMTELIEDQRLEEVNNSSDAKTTVNEQSDSSVTQSPLDVIDSKQGQTDSVNDVSNNTEDCPQVTQSDTTELSPRDGPEVRRGEELTENDTKMECNSSPSDSFESPKQQNDTSSNNSCDVKTQQQAGEVLLEDKASTVNKADCNSEVVPDESIRHDSPGKLEEEQTTKPDVASEESSTALAAETTDEKSDELLKSEVKEADPVSSLQNDAFATETPAATTTSASTSETTTTSIAAAATTATAAQVVNSQKDPPSGSVSPVALDGETGKSDTACAPEPSEKATPKDATSSSPGEKAATSNALNEKVPPESVYHVKWVQFKAQSTAIVTQNENGPCPLLAIMNCLLLQGRVKLPAMMEMVTSSQLMEYLGDCILENTPKNITEDALLNYEQNMQDAMDVFHKLQTGLDVNVKFTGVSDFEYTRECIVFDLLNIPLYHGWLVDPESPEVVAAVGNCSYNQLVEKIISQKNSNREELMTEALIAEEYLERTAAQLTYHGLSELVTTVKEDELCVFFRNNHFSTLYKHKKELFLLVTDQGFLTETNVVWETLSNVEGDGHFVDTDFRTFRKPEPSTAPIAAPEIPLGTDQQIDQDYLVALSLQQEQQVVADHPPAPAPGTATAWQPPADRGLEPTLSDHELALRLQEEEDRRAAMAANQRQAAGGHPGGAAAPARAPLQHQASTASSSGGSRKEKKSDSGSSTCTIL